MSILTSADKYRYELESLLTDEIDRLKEASALGFLEDFSQYKHLTGRIAGLRAAIDFLAEAESKCNSQ